MEETLARLETQMAVLARRIESTARQSTTFQRMDRASYLIARTLDEDGPLSVNEIARVLGLDGSTVTRQVATMEARGQITRKIHPADGRAWVISLTAAGRREMESISTLRRQRFARWLAEWPEADVAAFAALLQRFNDTLATAPAVPAGGAGGDPHRKATRNTEHRQSVLSPRRRR